MDGGRGGKEEPRTEEPASQVYQPALRALLPTSLLRTIVRAQGFWWPEPPSVAVMPRSWEPGWTPVADVVTPTNHTAVVSSFASKPV